MSDHANLNPSASKRWGGPDGCRASAKRSAGIPRSSNPSSRLGTAKHYVSALCLEKGLEPVTFLGKRIVFVSEIDEPGRERECFDTDVDLSVVILNAEFVIDESFVEHVDTYVSFVREQVFLSGGTLYVEQRLSIEHITGEAGAKGTSDAVIVCDDTLIVIDAKFGASKVNAYEA